MLFLYLKHNEDHAGDHQNHSSPWSHGKPEVGLQKEIVAWLSPVQKTGHDTVYSQISHLQIPKSIWSKGLYDTEALSNCPGDIVNGVSILRLWDPISPLIAILKVFITGNVEQFWNSQHLEWFWTLGVYINDVNAFSCPEIREKNYWWLFPHWLLLLFLLFSPSLFPSLFLFYETGFCYTNKLFLNLLCIRITMQPRLGLNPWLSYLYFPTHEITSIRHHVIPFSDTP